MNKQLFDYLEIKIEEANDLFKSEWEEIKTFFQIVIKDENKHGYKGDLDIKKYCDDKNIHLDPKELCSKLEEKQLIECMYPSPAQRIFVLKTDKNVSKYFTLSEKYKFKSGSEEEDEDVAPFKKETFSIAKAIEEKNLTNEDIENIAKNILELSKGETPEDIIEVFKLISQPFNEGEGLKEKVLLKVLELAGIEASYEENIGIRVPSKTEKKFIVVSHIDLIPSFNKGFCTDKVYEIEENKVIGALDNTMTNAVALMSLLSLNSEEKINDVEFVFTEAEETNLGGIKNYLKKYPKVSDVFFINLDVTNDNWKSNSSVEYDFPSYKICKQLIKKLDNAGSQKDRVCDDFDEIAPKGGRGFSYCLPTNKTIHSYKNYTLKEKLVPYLKGLKWLITELDISESKPDIKSLSLKKALKCETYKKFLKKEEERRVEKEKEAAERRKSYASIDRRQYDSYSGTGSTWEKYKENEISERFGISHEDEEDYGLQGFDETPSYSRKVSGPLLNTDFDEADFVAKSDIINLENVISDINTTLSFNEISVSKELKAFINNFVYSQDQFSIDVLAGFIGSLDKADQVITLLDSYFMIEEIDKGVYQFPSKSEYKLG